MHAKHGDPPQELGVIQPQTADDDWLDATLDQSFPASDPVPSFRGESSHSAEVS
jgi:hypothetical protein